MTDYSDAVERGRLALALARSIALSGEQVSPADEAIFDDGLKALDSLTAAGANEDCLTLNIRADEYDRAVSVLAEEGVVFSQSAAGANEGEGRHWTLTNPFGTGPQVDGPEISLSEEVEVVEARARARLLSWMDDQG